MKTGIAVSIILLLGSIMIVRQHKNITSLREQNQSLSEMDREIASLRKQNLLLSNGNVDTNQLQNARSEHVELMKLRGQVSDIRRIAKTPEEMRAAIQTIRSQIEVEKKGAELLWEQAKAKVDSEKMLPTLTTLSSIVRELAKLNGEFPNSIEQANQWAQSTRFHSYFNVMMTNTSADIVPLSAFEFLPRGEPLKFGEARPALFLREREPRRQPEGGWKRAYAYSDRNAVEVALPDGDFATWEREHLTSKP
jgi:uncharacterized protein YoxC